MATSKRAIKARVLAIESFRRIPAWRGIVGMFAGLAGLVALTTTAQTKAVIASETGLAIEIETVLMELPDSSKESSQRASMFHRDVSFSDFDGPPGVIFYGDTLTESALAEFLDSSPGAIKARSKMTTRSGKPINLKLPKAVTKNPFTIKARVEANKETISLQVPGTIEYLITSGETSIFFTRSENNRRYLLLITGRVSNEKGEKVAARPRPPKFRFHSTLIELTPAALRRLKLDSQIAAHATSHSKSPSIWDDEKIQGLWQSLRLQEGVETYGIPSATANGRILIEIIREFRHPLDFRKDPENPQQWLPENFVTTNTGLALDMTPTKKPNGDISLVIKGQMIEFLGFVDMETGKPVPLDKPHPKPSGLVARIETPPLDHRFTPGHRNRAIFSDRNDQQTVTLKSGQSVLLVLKETADLKPFQADAPTGYLIAIVTARAIK